MKGEDLDISIDQEIYQEFLREESSKASSFLGFMQSLQRVIS